MLTIVFTEAIAVAESSIESTRGITSSLNGIETPQPRIPSALIPATAEGRSEVVNAL